MAGVVEGIAGGKYRLFHQFRHGLDAQTAGDHKHAFRFFRDNAGKLPLCLDPVAQEIDLYRAGNGLSLFLGEPDEFFAIGLVDGLEFLEALVTGDDEDPVRAGKHLGEFIGVFQPVLGIVLQFLTFLI